MKTFTSLFAAFPWSFKINKVLLQPETNTLKQNDEKIPFMFDYDTRCSIVKCLVQTGTRRMV
jgi:hypothetical protein